MVGTNSTTLAPLTPNEDIAEEQHVTDSYLLLVLLLLLFMTIMVVWRFHLKRFMLLHETGVSLIIGIIAGLIINSIEAPLRRKHNYHPAVCNATLRDSYQFEVNHAQYVEDVEDETVFDPEIFFWVLLPPIIFFAAYDLKQVHFFRNIGGILLFAFLGTAISAFVTGALVWAYASTRPALSMTATDSFLLGSLLSCTDPVTVLAIFNDMGVEHRLYALVFGESMLNDAVGIVLYNSIANFRPATGIAHLNASTAIFSIWIFLLIFFGSMACGAFLGMLSAAFFKFTNIKQYPLLETSVFILLSYSAFVMAEASGLTGIIATLFCGMTQAHYTYNNLSEESRFRTKRFFELLNFLFENFIFSYMGLNFFTYKCHRWDAGFIAFGIFAILLTRALHVFPLSFLINSFTSKRGKRISWSHQVVIFWSGLRGAIAFALAIRHSDTEADQLMLSTTLAIVLFTVLIQGGTTPAVMKLLGIKTGAAANLDVSGDADGGSYSLLGETPVAPRPVKSWVARIWQGMDRKYIRPVLNVTEDGQGTQSWSDIRRTISNYFSGIPEDTRQPAQQVNMAPVNGHGLSDDEEDSELDREESFVAGDLGATWTQRTAMTSDSSPPFSPFDTDAKKSGNEISF